MDETLIHCVDDVEGENPDIILQVTFPTGEVVDAGINVRPYALDCLREANKNFQVIVFTASHKFYADVVLDYLDPNRELIDFRLYRDHCFQSDDGVYIKDLRVVANRDLKDMVIVDNAVYSFGFQLENGIPIIPFYNNPDDEELLHLINYINCLAYFEDLREQNARAFQLRELENTNVKDYLAYFFGENMDNSEAIYEEENEDEESSVQCVSASRPALQASTAHNKQMSKGSSGGNSFYTSGAKGSDQSSEIDQQEIMGLKKRLTFDATPGEGSAKKDTEMFQRMLKTLR